MDVSNIIADFIEEVSEAEAESILHSIYKARTEEESKSRYFKAIQQKMELYIAECEGEEVVKRNNTYFLKSTIDKLHENV